MLDSASSNVWRVGLALTALKLLMVPTYHSTDFEVHRNWMAVTSTLPVSQWYTEETSEWTLDYPPLFAWFEWLLAHPAALFDPAMLYVTKLPYISPECILFQRLSVAITDAVFLSGTWLITKSQSGSHKGAIRILVAANVGLLLVDHIHFQYNGLLIGILLWSIALIQEGRDLAAAFCFAVLLNMKHLFAALAPLYIVYLFRHYCRGPGALHKFLTLGCTVAAVFAVSFGPFALMGQMPQLLRRLFPFHRGLLHAYWAPNVWAVYAIVDKVLPRLMQIVGMPFTITSATMTGGLVQAASFSVLPDVGAGAAASAVFASMAPLLVAIWKQPSPAHFASCTALASLNSFMLGYHVHEKAILLVIVPLTLGAAESLHNARLFLRLSAIGHYSLLPLIFTRDEYLLKMLMVIAYTLASFVLLDDTLKGGHIGGQEDGPSGLTTQRGPSCAHILFPTRNAFCVGLLTWVDFLAVIMMTLLEMYCVLLHPFLLPSLPFWPLLLTSACSSVGLIWVWLDLWRLRWLHSLTPEVYDVT